MKSLSLVLFFVAVTFSSFAHAEMRFIFLIEQRNPAHIVYVSVADIGAQALVRVEGLGASKIKEQGVIPIAAFEDLWKLGNSDAVKSFETGEGFQGSMAASQYFTVVVQQQSGVKTTVQIPVSETQGEAGEFVSKITRFIPDESR